MWLKLTAPFLYILQWPTLVVHLSDSQFAIDTSLCFGFAPSAGIYGNVGGAGVDIMHLTGLGPILCWVDDHLFIRVLRESLNQYNHLWATTAQGIASLGGLSTAGGRSWFLGGTLPNGQTEEFNEDCSFPLQDHSTRSPCPTHDTTFCYNMHDIDSVSDTLGIPWELSKDIPFSSTPTFIGFIWDLDNHTICLIEAKGTKCVKALHDWNLKRTHALNDVQKLHNKLIHVSLIAPESRPYLTNIEAMLTICANKPFMPHTPPRSTQDDIK